MSQEPDEELPDEELLDAEPESTAARDRKSTLSIVSTPIGNLEDITLRALRTLREADLVLAEDTRRTRVLCQQHGIRCTLRSFHAHSGPAVIEQVLTELAAGSHIALVTDAGTPLLSDPGAVLVSAARERGLQVETVPGPSAITAALTVAALPVDHFRFVGFLPRSGRRRREALAQLVADSSATVLFESPRRLLETLEELAGLLAQERQLSVCRELTKLHEEVVRGSANELCEHFRHTAPRGEITLVIAGNAGAAPQLDEAVVDRRIHELLQSGSSTKDAAAQLASETGLRKQQLYARIEACKAELRTQTADD
ncbi:MAG TPA: 16S rRNA (cytidine(1402)-2'-O)-methyltransferase [Polyangiales bacterium]|nr:16S rRNA (cytidine(1402)-2'-O)-methyltransferase [Polyangiales bacterium]